MLLLTFTFIHTRSNLIFARKMSAQFLKNVFMASVNSVQPQILIDNNVALRGRHLVVKGVSYELCKPCYMVGFGKAVHKMALELEAMLGCHLQRAVVTVPKGTLEHVEYKTRIEFIEGAEHNLPDQQALEGARKIKILVEDLKIDDLLIVLISGGGSALLPLPKPDITLEEKLSVVKNLGKCGADIFELNSVRKQLSILKGGGLAQLAYPSKVVALILSDVVGDPLDFIASGPTVENLDESQTATNILRKYKLYDALPCSIKRVLKNSQDQKQQNFDHVTNYVIGSNMIAATAAKEAARKSDVQAAVISTEVQGNVNDIVEVYVDLANEVRGVQAGRSRSQLETKLSRGLKWKLQNGAVEEVMGMDFSEDVCLIFAGEPTVVVRGSGRGGRSQHLALAFSLEMDNWEEDSSGIFLLCAGTDGADGPTEAAGAIGTKGVGLEARRYLDNSDSYGFFKQFENGERLVVTGHTGTNVMDIHILLIKKI